MASIEKMVDHAIGIAEDDWYGYSWADRWYHNRDCSSLMYDSANAAGYDIGRGDDETRYTGTMIDDFTAAGFTCYDYDEVEERRGDILLRNPGSESGHTEMYIGGGKTVGAHIAETGGVYGQDGDQTGHEISVEWNPGNWDYILRPPADDYYEEDDMVIPIHNYGGPCYRLRNDYNKQHHFTLSKGERDDLVKIGWVDEGVAFETRRGGSDPVYRCFNRYNGEHVFTPFRGEMEKLQAAGWVIESAPFFAWGPGEGGTEVHRLYNESAKVHHMTADKDEIAKLVASGWTDEFSFAV